MANRLSCLYSFLTFVIKSVGYFMGHYSTNGTIIHRAEVEIKRDDSSDGHHASLFEIIARIFSLPLISRNLPWIKNVVKRWLQDCCRKYWIERQMWLVFLTEAVGG